MELAELPEIPTLARHAKELTKQGQIRCGSKFLVDVLSVLNSLQIWATDHAFFTELGRIQQMKNMSGRLDILRKVRIPVVPRYLPSPTRKSNEGHQDLNGSVAQLVQSCEDKLEKGIIEELRATLSNVNRKVVAVVRKWPQTGGRPKGLLYATYNAVVRRQ